MQKTTIYKRYKSFRKSIEELDRDLNTWKQQFNMTEIDFFGFNMCMTEIFVNALYHGNKLDPNKYVELLIEADGNYLTVFIIDEGAGFALADVPDPTTEENLLKDYGRGIFITNNYARGLASKRTVRGFCVEFSITINNIQ